MKTTFLIVFALAFTQNTFSQKFKISRETKILVQRYDVYHELFTDDSKSPYIFWSFIMENNYEYQKFHKSTSRYKKAITDEFMNMVEYQSFFYERSNPSDFEEIITKLKTELVGERFPKKIKNIFLIHDPTYNAWSAPDGNIIITNQLLKLLEPDELIGILAHEVAHYLLDHALINSFKFQKRERNNEIIAGVVSATYVGVTTWAQAQGAYNDEKAARQAWEDVNKTIISLFYAAKEDAILYKYKYSREQEIEADILAYRFLQYMGISPIKYINALKKLRDNSPERMPSLFDDHPSTSYRINLLLCLDLID